MNHDLIKKISYLSCGLMVSTLTAAPQISGEIRLSSHNTLSHETQDGSQIAVAPPYENNLWVSRAQLVVQDRLWHSWEYGLQLRLLENRNEQLGLDSHILTQQNQLPFTDYSFAQSSQEVVIGRAYLQYKGLTGVPVTFGRIQAPEITSDRVYYQPYIGKYANDRPVGSVLNDSGDHSGVKIGFSQRAISCQMGLWKQTDIRDMHFSEVEDYIVESKGKGLRLGYGGRLSYHQGLPCDGVVGFGLGYRRAPLNIPVMVLVSGTRVGISEPHELIELSVDMNATVANWQLNMGYQCQTLPTSEFMALGAINTFSDLAEILPFQQKSTATALWCEAGYLIQGLGYAFDPHHAVVAGVKLRDTQPALELTGRYGMETRTNTLALLTPTGWRDFRTNENGDQADDDFAAGSVFFAVEDDAPELHPSLAYIHVEIDNNALRLTTGTAVDALEEKMHGFSLGFNYYLTEHSVLKIELEHRHNTFRKAEGSQIWQGSLEAKNITALRLRSDYRF